MFSARTKREKIDVKTQRFGVYFGVENKVDVWEADVTV